MRVNVRGTIYESVQEAAKATGRSVKTVYAAIDSGRTDQLGTGTPKAYRPHPARDGKPHCIAGVWFPSISALARYIGKDVSHTRVALNKGGRAYANLEKRVRARDAGQDRDP
jgi:hypothetical protein